MCGGCAVEHVARNQFSSNAEMWRGGAWRDSLWRARDFAPRDEAPMGGGIRTGFVALDAALFDRGWPRQGLAELLCDVCGIGELRLLMPALASLAKEEARWIAWVAPPFVPYAPALEAAGVDLGKVLLIRPGSHREALWGLQQALRTGACSAVLGWLPEASLGFSELRRLALAARQGGTWGVLFRPRRAADAASGAELRLRLSPGLGNRLRVDVVKRRGGWQLPGIEVGLDASFANHGSGRLA